MERDKDGLPFLTNDMDLVKLVEEEMEFEFDEKLKEDPIEQASLIAQFLNDYDNTDVDQLRFAPEFKIVALRILEGYRPRKLVFLTGFEGEEE